MNVKIVPGQYFLGTYLYFYKCIFTWCSHHVCKLFYFVPSGALKINPGGVFAIYSKEIHSEGLWYRVKVLKVKGDKAHIEYLDYGDSGTVPISSLRSIPPRFLELPFQVYYY